MKSPYTPAMFTRPTYPAQWTIDTSTKAGSFLIQTTHEGGFVAKWYPHGLMQRTEAAHSLICDTFQQAVDWCNFIAKED